MFVKIKEEDYVSVFIESLKTKVYRRQTKKAKPFQMLFESASNNSNNEMDKSDDPLGYLISKIKEVYPNGN
ncbi:hypothetical protein [Evansella tamaricis]|uniref:Uncharacterized protein n=1 Tax=Evansella tamaricis TaxID=2069301 RepID=A0ABS6JBZ1_9BACI|nr:hypothetical protein [Evansella tamaricis]MBU9711197.1 hypothetical protein [Evansella tamaricis]